MPDITLLYIKSKVVVDFIAKYPINWYSLQDATKGNILTPTPAVSVFFDLLKKKGDLFTQDEYITERKQRWGKWFEKNKKISKYLDARLGRNFYPSCIDSLHFFSLAVENRHFEKCLLNTVLDAIGKVDLILFYKGCPIPINVALQIGTSEATKRRIYKDKFRKKNNVKIYTVTLPLSRSKKPGNKRWYTPGDVLSLVKKVKHEAAGAVRATKN